MYNRRNTHLEKEKHRKEMARIAKTHQESDLEFDISFVICRPGENSHHVFLSPRFASQSKLNQIIRITPYNDSNSYFDFEASSLLIDNTLEFGIRISAELAKHLKIDLSTKNNLLKGKILQENEIPKLEKVQLLCLVPQFDNRDCYLMAKKLDKKFVQSGEKISVNEFQFENKLKPFQSGAITEKTEVFFLINKGYYLLFIEISAETLMENRETLILNFSSYKKEFATFIGSFDDMGVQEVRVIFYARLFYDQFKGVEQAKLFATKEYLRLTEFKTNYTSRVYRDFIHVFDFSLPTNMADIVMKFNDKMMNFIRKLEIRNSSSNHLLRAIGSQSDPELPGSLASSQDSSILEVMHIFLGRNEVRRELGNRRVQSVKVIFFSSGAALYNVEKYLFIDVMKILNKFRADMKFYCFGNNLMFNNVIFRFRDIELEKKGEMDDKECSHNHSSTAPPLFHCLGIVVDMHDYQFKMKQMLNEEILETFKEYEDILENLFHRCGHIAHSVIQPDDTRESENMVSDIFTEMIFVSDLKDPSRRKMMNQWGQSTIVYQVANLNSSFPTQEIEGASKNAHVFNYVNIPDFVEHMKIHFLSKSYSILRSVPTLKLVKGDKKVEIRTQDSKKLTFEIKTTLSHLLFSCDGYFRILAHVLTPEELIFEENVFEFAEDQVFPWEKFEPAYFSFNLDEEKFLSEYSELLTENTFLIFSKSQVFEETIKNYHNFFQSFNNMLSEKFEEFENIKVNFGSQENKQIFLALKMQKAVIDTDHLKVYIRMDSSIAEDGIFRFSLSTFFVSDCLMTKIQQLIMNSAESFELKCVRMNFPRSNSYFNDDSKIHFKPPLSSLLMQDLLKRFQSARFITLESKADVFSVMDTMGCYVVSVFPSHARIQNNSVRRNYPEGPLRPQYENIKEIFQKLR